ncbi:MAPEG family protein [Leptospira idonii]|uniref:MAPEG family protein n=1 Tax=Leptospira idonii TaxID=1193500 RepID=A0A4R9LXR3_9LEPT|nr:MAPEG family protein [Leptospira idonii]TGN19124.1 MAPEG family protein [Leptospira idonii]
MNQTILSLLLFVSWTMALGFSLISYRSIQVLLGRKKSNEFPAGIQHGTDRYWRLNRAHANALENLPIFATLVILGNLTGKIDYLFVNLSFLVVFARVIQSLIHISSGSAMAVNFRFTAYITQLICFVVFIWLIIS